MQTPTKSIDEYRREIERSTVEQKTIMDSINNLTKTRTTPSKVRSSQSDTPYQKLFASTGNAGPLSPTDLNFTRIGKSTIRIPHSSSESSTKHLSRSLENLADQDTVARLRHYSSQVQQLQNALHRKNSFIADLEQEIVHLNEALSMHKLEMNHMNEVKIGKNASQAALTVEMQAKISMLTDQKEQMARTLQRMDEDKEDMVRRQTDEVNAYKLQLANLSAQLNASKQDYHDLSTMHVETEKRVSDREMLQGESIELRETIILQQQRLADMESAVEELTAQNRELRERNTVLEHDYTSEKSKKEYLTKQLLEMNDIKASNELLRDAQRQKEETSERNRELLEMLEHEVGQRNALTKEFGDLKQQVTVISERESELNALFEESVAEKLSLQQELEKLDSTAARERENVAQVLSQVVDFLRNSCYPIHQHVLNTNNEELRFDDDGRPIHPLWTIQAFSTLPDVDGIDLEETVEALRYLTDCMTISNESSAAIIQEYSTLRREYDGSVASFEGLENKYKTLVSKFKEQKQLLQTVTLERDELGDDIAAEEQLSRAKQLEIDGLQKELTTTQEDLCELGLVHDSFIQAFEIEGIEVDSAEGLVNYIKELWQERQNWKEKYVDFKKEFEHLQSESHETRGRNEEMAAEIKKLDAEVTRLYDGIDNERGNYAKHMAVACYILRDRLYRWYVVQELVEKLEAERNQNAIYSGAFSHIAQALDVPFEQPVLSNDAADHVRQVNFVDTLTEPILRDMVTNIYKYCNDHEMTVEDILVSTAQEQMLPMIEVDHDFEPFNMEYQDVSHIVQALSEFFVLYSQQEYSIDDLLTKNSKLTSECSDSMSIVEHLQHSLSDARDAILKINSACSTSKKQVAKRDTRIQMLEGELDRSNKRVSELSESLTLLNTSAGVNAQECDELRIKLNRVIEQNQGNIDRLSNLREKLEEREHKLSLCRKLAITHKTNADEAQKKVAVLKERLKASQDREESTSKERDSLIRRIQDEELERAEYTKQRIESLTIRQAAEAELEEELERAFLEAEVDERQEEMHDIDLELQTMETVQ
ncbi:hypothetical protein PCE1_000370 [Barthelona sp. PCE]